MALTQPLRVQPPTLSSPVVVHVSGNYNAWNGSDPTVRVAGHVVSPYGGNVINAAGKDVQVIFDGVMNVNLRINDYANLYVKGGEVYINNPIVDPAGWTSGTMPFNNLSDPHGWLNGPRNAIQIQTTRSGTSYFEGCYLHGPYIIDGIKQSGPLQSVVMQACLVVNEYSGAVGSGGNWTNNLGGFHLDCFQSYGGVGTLDIDWCTFITGYQGIMTKAEGKGWGTTRLSRLNFASSHARGFNTADSTRGGTGGPYSLQLNIVLISDDASVVGPFYCDDVWLEPDPGTWGNLQSAFGSMGNATGNYTSDTETGKQRVWFSGRNNPNPLFPGGTFFNAPDAKYFRHGPPIPTIAHPENPSGDYCAVANAGTTGYPGLLYGAGPGYIGITPPPPPTSTPLVRGSSNRPPYSHYQTVA